MVSFLYEMKLSVLKGVLALTYRSCAEISNSSSFFHSVSAVYLLWMQEELLLTVLRASGESAHLCHMSFAKGDGVSAAASHAPTSQGLAPVLAAPQHPNRYLQGKRRPCGLGSLSPRHWGRGGRRGRRQPALTFPVHANLFHHAVRLRAVCFCRLSGGAAQQEWQLWYQPGQDRQHHEWLLRTKHINHALLITPRGAEVCLLASQFSN